MVVANRLIALLFGFGMMASLEAAASVLNLSPGSIGDFRIGCVDAGPNAGACTGPSIRGPGPDDEINFSLAEGSGLRIFSFSPGGNGSAGFNLRETAPDKDLGTVTLGDQEVHVFAGLTTGTPYRLNVQRVGGVTRYEFMITPVPAAVLLLGTALAGLGFARYRRKGLPISRMA